MTTLEKVEMAIADLPKGDYPEFRELFLQKDGERWDRQMEEDPRAGRPWRTLSS